MTESALRSSAKLNVDGQHDDEGDGEDGAGDDDDEDDADADENGVGAGDDENDDDDIMPGDHIRCNVCMLSVRSARSMRAHEWRL